MKKLEKLISLAEAAKISEYNQDYLGSLIRKGEIKAEKVGKAYFTTEKEIQDFISRQKRHHEKLAQKKNFFNRPVPPSFVYSLVILVGLSVVGSYVLSDQSKLSIITSGWNSFIETIENNAKKIFNTEDNKSNVATALFAFDSNILDPGSPTTLWGGCGPLDPNCYPIPLSSSSTKNKNTTLKINTPTTTTTSSSPRISVNISNSTLISALRNLFSGSLPNDLLSKLQGPMGPAGPIGPKGDAGINIASGNTTYTPLPSVYLPGAIVPPNPTSNYSGGSLFGATDLSSKNFISTTATITDFTVSGNSTLKNLSVTGTTTLSGDLALSGSTTLGNNFSQTGSGTFSTGTGAISLNGDTTLATDKNFTQNGTGTFTTGSGLTSLGGNLTVIGTAWTATPTISGLITATSGLTSNGNITVQNNSNISQTGSGTFSTGTGAISLNGDTTLATDKNFTQNGTGTFTTGSGAITLNGNVSLGEGKSLNTSGQVVLNYIPTSTTDYTIAIKPKAINPTNRYLYSGSYTDTGIMMGATSDYKYFGHATKFTGVYLAFSTPGVGYNLVLEYSKGAGVWGTISSFSDDTTNFNTNGSLFFAPPSDWATDTVNGATDYWVRVSTSTNPTTTAIGSTNNILPAGYAIAAYLSPTDSTPKFYVDYRGNVQVTTLLIAQDLSVTRNVASDLIPDANNTRNLGSATNYWSTAYVNTINANNIIATATEIGGTKSETFTLNSDNSPIAPDQSIVFSRTTSPNPVFGWSETNGTFTLNGPLVFTSGTGTASISLPGDVDSTAGGFKTNSVTRLDNAGNLQNIGSYASSLTPAGTTAVDLISGTLTNNTTSGNQTLLSLTNAGTGTTEKGIYLNNTGTGTNAIEVAGTWTNGLIVGSGNVGIGTTAPDQKLAVSGGHIQIVDQNGELKFYNNSRITSFQDDLSIINANSGKSLIFGTVGTERVRIDSSGNVGIGTTAPGSKLTLGSGQLELPVGSVSAPALTFSGNLNYGFYLSGASPTIVRNGVDQISFSGTDTYIIPTTLRIGPYSATDNSATTSTIYASQSSGAGNNGAKLALSGGAPGAGGSYGNLFLQPNGGNVGIGTTAPGEKLHIQGGSGILISNSSATWVYAGGQSLQIHGNSPDILLKNTSATANEGIWTAFETNATQLFGRVLNDSVTSSQNWITVTRSGATISSVVFPSGNIGIGTTSPNKLLTVTATTANTSASLFTINYNSSTGFAGAANLILQNTDSSTNNWNSIVFHNAGGVATSGIASQNIDQTNNYGDIAFFTRNSTNFSERMRLTSSGNIGIGTTAPAAPLEVINNGIEGIRVSRAGVDQYISINEGGNGAHIIEGFGNKPFNIKNRASSLYGISFLVNTSIEAQTITNSGLVGIGTTSPTANFQVAQSTSGVGTVSTTATLTTVTGVGTQFLNTFKVGDTITVNAETRTISAIASNTSLTTDAWTGTNNGIAYTLVGGTRFSVLGNGNVGIGTTAPGEKLSIYQSADSSGLKIYGYDDRVDRSLNMYVNSSGNAYIDGYDELFVGGYNKTTIKTSGLVVLTTSNAHPAYSISMEAPGGTFAGINGNFTSASVTSGTYSLLRVAYGSSGGGVNAFSFAPTSGTVDGKGVYITPRINTSGTYTGTYSALDIAVTPVSTTGLTDDTLTLFKASYDGSEKFRINRAGNVGIGTTAPGSKLTLGSGQLELPVGSVSAPALTFSGNLNYGFYLSGASPTIVRNGVDQISFSGTDTYIIPTTLRIGPYSATDNSATTSTIYASQSSGAGNNGAKLALSGGAPGAGGSYGNLFLQPNGGNVGIGTASPIYKLDVQGTSGTVAIRALSNTAGDILYYGTGTVTGNLEFFKGSISATNSVQGTIYNTNSTSGTANARLSLTTTGDSGGDPYVDYCVSGVKCWVSGIDNSDGDKFKISTDNNLGSGDRLVIDTTGNVGIATATPNNKFQIANDATYGNNDTYQLALTDLSDETLRMNIGFIETGGYGILQTMKRGVGYQGNIAIQPGGGNVGIGITNPANNLHVSSTANNSGINWILGLMNPGNDQTAAVGTGLKFYNVDTTRWVGITSVNENDYSHYMGMAFYTNNGDSIAERMRISRAGNVGIGTTSPNNKLQITGTNGNISFNVDHGYFNQIVATPIGANGKVFRISNAGVSSTADSTGILIDGENAWTQTSGTNVLLDVAGYGTGWFSFAPTSGTAKFIALNIDPKINQTGTATGDYTALQVNVTETSATGTNKRLMDLQVGGSSKMVVTSAGNVGIGTTAPGYPLEISSSTGNATLRLGSLHNSDVSQSILKFFDTSAGGITSAGGLYYKANDTIANSFFGFSADDTNYNMVILRTGNVGIGDTTPDEKLDIEGGNIRLSTASSNITFWGDGSVNTSGDGALSLLGGKNTDSTSTDVLILSTNTRTAGNILQIRNNGSNLVTVDYQGNVGIGTTAPNGLLQVGSVDVLPSDTTGLKVSNNIISGGYIRAQTGLYADQFLALGSGLTFRSTTSGIATLLNPAENGWTRLNFGGTTSSFPALAVNGSDLQVIRADGSTNANLLVTGNVGIGTTAPSSKLEVIGDIVSKGTSWTSRTSPASNEWRSITYGNGLFVAVTTSGILSNKIMTSPDGINWTARSAPEDNSWSSVTYGNGMFVAVSSNGTNRVMTSPDGINWTARSAAAANSWSAVTYGNGTFVAISYSGTDRVMTSPDGINWTARSAAAANSWINITYGNGLFVAIAYDGTASNNIMTSPNGISWTSRTSPIANQWISVTYGNGLFVAVSLNGTTSNNIMTSSDGISWISRISPTANQWNSVTYGNGLFVAVAYNGTTSNNIMTSPNGISWTSRTSPTANQWYSVTYGNGMFVAVSANGTTSDNIMTSGKTDYSLLATNNIYQGGMNIFGNVGIGTTAPTNLLSLDGTVARTIWMERNTTAATAGQGLTLSSGGAIAGTADLAGGDLTLKSGISTGTGTSALHFYTATAGTTGTTDNTPTEKMTILGSGNVGIGTTAPVDKLHIWGVKDSSSDTSATGLIISDTTTQALGTGGGIVFRGKYTDAGAETTSGAIHTYKNDAVTGNFGFDMAFNTRINGGSNTEKMRISSSGNVGIGTTAPEYVLDINKSVASDTWAQIQSISNTNIDVGLRIETYPNDGTEGLLLFSRNDDATMHIDTIGTTPLVLQNDGGNVGIGILAPDAKLELTGTVKINTTSAASSYATREAVLNFGLSNYLTTYRNRITNSSSSALADATMNFELASGASTYVTAMTLNGSGNVGIGTSAPASKLEINGGATEDTFTTTAHFFGNTGNKGISGSIRFQSSSDSDSIANRYSTIQSLYGSTAYDLILNPSGGNVGIGTGTTAPSAPLEVKGTGTGATIAKFTDVNTTGCTLATGGTIACSSDVNLKKNIENITYGLDTVLTLRPVLYNWKYEEEGSTKSLGFIAQEVETIIPKLVSTDEDGIKSLNTTGIIPIMVKAIQELDLKINNLTTQIGEPTTSFGDYASAFFSEVLTKVEGSVAYMKALVLDSLKVGSPTKRTGITLYDEVSGDPYCISVANGTTKTTPGECVVIEVTPPVSSDASSTSTSGDITPPVITLNGEAIINLNVGDTYTEAGATATDDIDGEVAIVISGAVDTSITGIYTITYNATDSSTNNATATRTVNVGDVSTLTPPPTETTTTTTPTETTTTNTTTTPTDTTTNTTDTTTTTTTDTTTTTP